MPALQWSDTLALGLPSMDATHHEFVDLLAGVVLQVMREGEKRGGQGDLAVVRQMADELGIWFPQHAQSMDAALALHLRSVGYDEHTGEVNMPQALPREAIEGCHGAGCATGEEQDTALATH